MAKFIPLLVRTDYLEDVARYVAQLEASRPADDTDEVTALFTRAQPPSTPGAEAPAGSLDPTRYPELAAWPSWPEADLRRLANGDTETTKRWARALDVCAATPATYLSTSQVAERSGMTLAEWRDAPRKITRHLKAHYPNLPQDENGYAIWPLHAKSVPEHPGEVSWAITAEMAELWKKVRS